MGRAGLVALHWPELPQTPDLLPVLPTITGPVLAHEVRYPGGDCSSDIYL